MNSLALTLKPIDHGWAVTLTDGARARPLHRARS